MKSITLVLLVAVVVVVVVVPRWSGLSVPADANADTVQKEALTFYMDHLRRLTHKLGLSIDARNPALASFYAQEITEFVEVIKARFPQYDGLQISALATAMLSPQVAVLSKTLAGKDWNKASADYDNLIAGCNGCHAATQRPFIKIVRSKTNPYNQDFSP